VGTLSVDLKEMCSKTATREYAFGGWFIRCRYKVGMGFGPRLSFFVLKISDVWNLTEVNY
jgi:hypothetical protein